MKTTATGLQKSLRIFGRPAFTIVTLICLLALTAVPMSAGTQQSIPSRYALSFVAQPDNGTVVIQQSVDFTARRQTTTIRQADQSLHQFVFSYNEQEATLLVLLQRRPVLSVSFSASSSAAPQVTWLNGTTPDSLHQSLFQDVQLLSQMRADTLSSVGLPIEAAYLSAFETADAIYGSAPNRLTRTTINADSALRTDPLVAFCAGYAADRFEICLSHVLSIGGYLSPSTCGIYATSAYVDCILILS